MLQANTAKRQDSEHSTATILSTLRPYPYGNQEYLDLSNEFYRKWLLPEPQNSNELNSNEDVNHLANNVVNWPQYKEMHYPYEMEYATANANEQHKLRHGFTANQQQQQQLLNKHATNIRFGTYLPAIVMPKRLAHQEVAEARATADGGINTIDNLFPLRYDGTDTFDNYYNHNNDFNGKNYHQANDASADDNANAADDNDVQEVFNNGNGNESLNYSGDNNNKRSNDMETYSHDSNAMLADNLEYLSKFENIKGSAMKRAKPLVGHTPFLPAVSGGKIACCL